METSDAIYGLVGGLMIGLSASLLMLFNAVPTKFVRTLIAGPQQFVQVLRARADQLENA